LCSAKCNTKETYTALISTQKKKKKDKCIGEVSNGR
jgi:hypothetical protein